MIRAKHNNYLKQTKESLSHEKVKGSVGALAKSASPNHAVKTIESKKEFIAIPPKKTVLPLLSKDFLEVQNFQAAFTFTKDYEPRDNDWVDDPPSQDDEEDLNDN